MRSLPVKPWLVLVSVAFLSSGCTSRPMSQPSTLPSDTASNNKFNDYLNPELPPADGFDFPLGDANHAGGKEAAMAAVCANSQGKFWHFHDKLFQNQKNFTNADLLSLAGQSGLNMELFGPCLESAAVKSKVEKDWIDGATLGVSGTPSFFINGEKVEGAIPLEAWEKAVGLIK